MTLRRLVPLFSLALLLALPASAHANTAPVANPDSIRGGNEFPGGD